MMLLRFSLRDAYKAHIISTIVDLLRRPTKGIAYKAHIISTIVDGNIFLNYLKEPIRLI